MEVRAAAAVLLGLALNASAATNTLTDVGPNGGGVNRIVYSQNGNTAFMAAEGGFYRSQDAGVSWQLMKSDFFNAPGDVAIDPADATRIYVVAPNAPFLYVSTDGGATLAASTATLPAAVTQVQKIAVSHDGATLYLSSDGRLFRSTDRGQTWLERAALSLDSSTQLLALVVDPADPATLYATTATASTATAGVFVSRDGAARWTQVISGTEQTTLVSDLAINPANPAQIWTAGFGGILVSADRGAHWSNLLSTAMYGVALDPGNPAIVYATSPYGQVFRSANAGTSWSDVSGNIAAGQNLHLTINPAHTSQLLAAGSAGISGSAGSGTTWSAQQSGFMATSIDSLSADPASDRIYIHARINGVFYTTSGDSAPARPLNNSGLLALEPPPTIDVTSILAQPGRLFAALTSGLTYSADGGETWAPTVEPLPFGGSQQLFSLSSAPGAPQTLLASTTGPLIRSVNGGAAWAPVSGQPAASTAYDIQFAPSDPATVYGMYFLSAPPGINLGIYKSLDAGASWAPVNGNRAASPTNLLAVDPVDARIAYGNNQFAPAPTVTPNSLLKTLDGGAHWSAISWDVTNPNSVPGSLTIDPLHPNILYAANNDRLARSVDAGETWETLHAGGLPLLLVRELLADPHRPETLYVGTNNAGVQQITIAPDLALTVSGPPASITTGATASYAYTATNLGPFDATGVRVAVQLPAGAQGATATLGTGTGSCTVSAQVATCIFPVVRKAASSTFTVTAIAPDAGAFTASASVSGEQPDPDLSSNTVTADTTVSAAVTTPSAPPASSAHSGGGGRVSFCDLAALLSLLVAGRATRRSRA